MISQSLFRQMEHVQNAVGLISTAALTTMKIALRLD